MMIKQYPTGGGKNWPPCYLDLTYPKGECGSCGWIGYWSEAIEDEDGDWESGYYTVYYCPKCESGYGPLEGIPYEGDLDEIETYSHYTGA